MFKSVEVWDVTYHTDLYGEIGTALGIIAAGAGTVTAINAVVPEPFLTKGAAAVTGVIAGVSSLGAGVFTWLSDEYELGRTLNQSGYYYGWKNFKVASYYRIKKLAECPYSWDIDFDINAHGMISTGDPVGEYPDTPLTVDHVGNFAPDPNTWNDWSDQEQSKRDGHKTDSME